MSDTSPQFDPQPSATQAPNLIADALFQAKNLIQSEIALAKREVKNKASRAVAGIAMMVLAGFLVLTALDVLTAFVVTGLAALGMPMWLATLTVFGVSMLVAIILFVVGRNKVMPDTLMPEKTIENVRKDIETIKETANV